MYRAPVSEISHTLMKVAGLEKALEENRFPEFSADLAAAILEEAGKFAATVSSRCASPATRTALP